MLKKMSGPILIALFVALAALVAPLSVLASLNAQTATGTVVAWGSSNWGELNVPAGLSGVMAIAQGGGGDLALKSDGTVVTWGTNDGELDVPAGLNGVVAIAAGDCDGAAIKNDGSLVTWGYGCNLEAYQRPPAVSGVRAIAVGVRHGIALKDDGTVVTWGVNEDGNMDVPPDLTGVVAIAAGGYQNLALRQDGSVVAWGGASCAPGTNAPPPGLAGAVAIATHDCHSLALKRDGTLVEWGAHADSQDIPAAPGGVKAIAASNYYAVLLRNDGTVVTWGQDCNFATPNPGCQVPAGLAGITAISANWSNVMALVGEPIPPTITISAPADGAAYYLNQLLAASYACSDSGGSGLASCSGTVPNGSGIDTTSAGSHTFTVNATDGAGNSSSKSVQYTVAYKNTGGFLGPVDSPPMVNAGKAGKTYPVKWQLTDAAGNYISALSAVSSITYKATACAAFTGDPTDALETTATGGTSLRYDSATNQYVYNWATPASAGCYTLFVTLDSGQVFQAYFSLSK